MKPIAPINIKALVNKSLPQCDKWITLYYNVPSELQVQGEYQLSNGLFLAANHKIY